MSRPRQDEDDFILMYKTEFRHNYARA